jgi:hypothetical protein
VYVGQEYQFSAGDISTNCAMEVDWVAEGGNPSSQHGGTYFMTHWDTPGTKTVTVSTSCDYDQIEVTVEPLCAEGLCCKTRNCEFCLSGTCIDRCPLLGQCKKCDGCGGCVTTCHPELCEECVNNECKVCGGDTNKKCCGGECKDKCKIIDGEDCDPFFIDNPCSTTCVIGPDDGLCGFASMTEWSGITEKICNPEGCPGDCHHDTDWCSKTYACEPSGEFAYLDSCLNFNPGFPPIPFIFHRCVTTYVGKCQSCKKGAQIDRHDVDNDSCN